MRAAQACALLLLSLSGEALAQTASSVTSDKLLTSQVLVAPNCDTSEFPVPAGPIGLKVPPPPVQLPPSGAGSLPAVLVPVVAGLLSDVAASGLKSLASGLAAASRERTYGGEGVDVFDFYQWKSGKLSSRVVDDGAGCILILLTPPDGKGPAFAARMRLETLANGFRIVPHELRYIRALPRAPSRALPLEFHAVFSVPAKTEAALSDQSVFAVARVRLPSMKPGDILVSDQLVGFSSQAMLVRSAPTENVNDGANTGTTGVLARLVLLKSANAFGESLATALGGRAPALGAAVDQGMQQALFPAGFGEADAALSLALVTVRQKQAALAAATTAGSAQDVVDAAALALAQAQAEANVKAAAAKRSLPYPELLN